MESTAAHPPLFSREQTLALVAEHLAAGTPCVLVGESGIGKSTLAAAAAEHEPRAFVGGGLATLAWMSYLPLQRAFRAAPHGDAVEVANDVAERVGDGVLVSTTCQWVDAATRHVLELLGGRVRCCSQCAPTIPAPRTHSSSATGSAPSASRRSLSSRCSPRTRPRRARRPRGAARDAARRARARQPALSP